MRPGTNPPKERRCDLVEIVSTMKMSRAHKAAFLCGIKYSIGSYEQVLDSATILVVVVGDEHAGDMRLWVCRARHVFHTWLSEHVLQRATVYGSSTSVPSMIELLHSSVLNHALEHITTYRT